MDDRTLINDSPIIFHPLYVADSLDHDSSTELQLYDLHSSCLESVRLLYISPV